MTMSFFLILFPPCNKIIFMTCLDSSANIQRIQEYIRKKNKGYFPGIAPATLLVPISTDMDNFPYNRFYRGMATCSSPRVFDREAGYRPWRQDLYQQLPSTLPPPGPRPNGCFQIPCSTILPCMSDKTFKPNIQSCVYTSP